MNANNKISGHVPELSAQHSFNHCKPHVACHSDIANGVPEKVPETIKLGETLAAASQRKIVFLRIKELQARIGLGRSAIYYLMDPNSPHYAPNFPRSVKISAHCIGWIEYEIEEFLQSRVSASRS